jgi:pimeloyl-ACP methyl ester carboxylesterase
MNTVVSRDATTIAFDRLGRGPALILVGGAFQHRANDPRTGEIAEQLSDRFTVYHYDRRGRGDSTDTQPYAIAREVEDLEALVADAGGEAYLFGHSSGAVLALDAVNAGLPVTRLAVYEPPLLVDGSRSPTPADYMPRLRGLIAAGAHSDAVVHFLTHGVGLPTEVVDSMRQSPMWGDFEAVSPTLSYDATLTDSLVAGTPLPTTRWAAVTLPVLVADGSASFPFMHSGADALAALLPDASRRTLPGQDHGVAAAALVPILIDFYSG